MDVIYAWAEPSSHGTTTYEILLHADGSLSCNCPGWVFQRPGKPRGCKHTKAYTSEARRLHHRYLAGEPLPSRTARSTHPPPSPPSQVSRALDFSNE